MSDAITQVSAVSAALTFRVQSQVLENLRASLVFADPAYAQQGQYDAGHNSLVFVNVPDLSVHTTSLTEGTRPDKRALTMGTVSITPAQKGDLVSITDLVRVLAPFEIATVASERVARSAAESIDQITRDAIALGGTAYYAGSNSARTDLAATDVLNASELRKLNTKMKKAKIPAFADGFYRLWAHPNQLYDLKNDSSTTGGFIDVTSCWRRNRANSVNALAA